MFSMKSIEQKMIEINAFGNPNIIIENFININSSNLYIYFWKPMFDFFIGITY